MDSLFNNYIDKETWQDVKIINPNLIDLCYDILSSHKKGTTAQINKLLTSWHITKEDLMTLKMRWATEKWLNEKEILLLLSDQHIDKNLSKTWKDIIEDIKIRILCNIAG